MGKVLVTGASGSIGVHICSGLIDKDHEVIALDYKPSPYNEGKRGYDFYSVSPTEKEKISRIFEQNIIESVIHCACTADNDIGPEITEQQVSESHLWDTFIYKMANLVGVKQFILVSTTQVYQAPTTREPVREDDDVKIVTNYARLKIAAEDAMAMEFKKSRTVAVCAARCTPFYAKEMPENLRARVVDSKTGGAYMYRTGEYGYHFCNVYNLVDFVISYIGNTDKVPAEQRSQHTGIYNVADKELISVSEIVNFMREYHTIGTVLQRKESDLKGGLIGKLFGSKPTPEAVTNYRFMEQSAILGNYKYETHKAARICPLRWNLQNTK
jgi:UDP-glucose 4-epimerase